MKANVYNEVWSCDVSRLNTLEKPATQEARMLTVFPLAMFTSLHGLCDKRQIQSAQKVLITDSSGGLGNFAVQIAKSFKTEVTGVCNTQNLDLVCGIGAEHVIDHTQEDLTQNEQSYDLVFYIVENRSFSDYRRGLNPNGICAVAGVISMSSVFRILIRGGKQVGMLATTSSDKKDLVFIKERIEEGKIVPINDKQNPLSETAEAIPYLEIGHARGKVVITLKQKNVK